MIYLTIKHDSGYTYIRVYPHPTVRYLYYTDKEVIQKYRKQFNLVGKHLTIVEV